MLARQEQRKRRHSRVRAKITGTADVPRICVFRSNKYVYCQLVNDASGKVLVSAQGEKTVKGSFEVGKDIAKKAQEKKVTKAVFDRGGYKYHGRIKSLAEGAREGGLSF